MINKDGFVKFLKAGGRTEEVARRVIRLVQVFAEFQFGRNQTSLDLATESDLDAFIEYVDQESDQLPRHDEIQPSIKSYLWALRYYYQFNRNRNMAAYAAIQRETRITRKPFALMDFRGVQPEQIAALASTGIRNTNQMLKAGSTPQKRDHLARQTGVPTEKILELVKLSDLARIPGVKGIRARLYFDAGFDTLDKLAHCQVDHVLQVTQDFVQRTGFDGIPPLPAEVSHTIKTARSLPAMVEYE